MINLFGLLVAGGAIFIQNLLIEQKQLGSSSPQRQNRREISADHVIVHAEDEGQQDSRDQVSICRANIADGGHG